MMGRSAECGVRNAELGEFGVRSSEWGMRSSECGVRSWERTLGLSLASSEGKGSNIRQSNVKLIEAGRREMAGVMLDGDVGQFQDFGGRCLVVDASVAGECGSGSPFYHAERSVQHDVPGSQRFVGAEGTVEQRYELGRLGHPQSPAV